MLLEINGEITPERMKRWSQSKNSMQMWMWRGGSKFWCCKEQYGIRTWNVRSISSVQSLSHVQLWPHELQHASPPCPSQTPAVYSNSCPSSLWCHPAISSFVIPFSSCPQSLPASGAFPMSQLFASGGQSIGVLALASVLPMNTWDGFPLGWTGWISL